MLLTWWTFGSWGRGLCFTVFCVVVVVMSSLHLVPQRCLCSICRCSHRSCIHPWSVLLWVMGWSRCLFSAIFNSDFCCSPVSFPFPPKMFRQTLSFWRMLFWNTAYDVIYCVIFLQQRLLFPLRSTTFWTVWQGRNELLVCFFSAMNFFKDIFLTHQCHHRFIKMEGKKVPLWTFGILNLFRWRSTFILYWIYVSHML